jgi:plasmid stability protein
MTTEDEIYEAAKRIGLFKLSNATLAADVEREMAEMSREAERLAAEKGTSVEDEYRELNRQLLEREKREMAEMSEEAERLAAKNGTSFIDEYIELYWLQREREKREDGC